MPLLAYTHSGEPLVAPLMSDEAWERLRSAKDRDAWMPGGKVRAIPKLSRLGTRFFAHPPGQASEGGRESDIHLYLKAQCLIGARTAGWEALPEQSGVTPDGRDWRADVLCRRPGKAWSVAFEAQVQIQGEEAYRQRQERYAASGVRALWLVAHEPAALHRYWLKPDQHLPAFRTTTWRDQDGRPGALVFVDGLSLGVAEFVAGTLSRQLQWYENGRHGIVALALREEQCWHRPCRKGVLVACKAEAASGGTLDLGTVQALAGYSEAYARAQTALPELADSPWLFRRVLATRCPHCRREIRYNPQDWTGQGTKIAGRRGTPQSSDRRVRVLIGVGLPEQALHLRIASLAQWHWGPKARWSHWAPIGGVGPITRPQTRDDTDPPEP
jgi:hypothetical protein